MADETTAVPFDLDDDSVADAYALDTDADGIADTTAFDLDEDSVIETVAVDTNADGVADVAYDLDGGSEEWVSGEDDLAGDPLTEVPDEVTNEDLDQAANDLDRAEIMDDYMYDAGYTS